MAAGRADRRRRAVSLPTRLTAIAALLVAATVLVVAGVAARLMRDDLGGSLDRRLSSAAASFRDGPAGRVKDPGQLAAEARRWLAVQAHGPDEVIAVRTAGGEVLSTSGGVELGAVDRSDDLLASTAGRWWTVAGPDGVGRLRALTAVELFTDLSESERAHLAEHLRKPFSIRIRKPDRFWEITGYDLTGFTVNGPAEEAGAGAGAEEPIDFLGNGW